MQTEVHAYLQTAASYVVTQTPVHVHDTHSYIHTHMCVQVYPPTASTQTHAGTPMWTHQHTHAAIHTCSTPMWVCPYTCVWSHTYVVTRLWAHTYADTHINVGACVCAHPCGHMTHGTHMWAHAHITHVHTIGHTYAHMLGVHVWTHMQIHLGTYIPCWHTYMGIHMWTCTYICVLAQTHLHTRPQG